MLKLLPAYSCNHVPSKNISCSLSVPLSDIACTNLMGIGFQVHKHTCRKLYAFCQFGQKHSSSPPKRRLNKKPKLTIPEQNSSSQSLFLLRYGCYLFRTGVSVDIMERGSKFIALSEHASTSKFPWREYIGYPQSSASNQFTDLKIDFNNGWS